MEGFAEAGLWLHASPQIELLLGWRLGGARFSIHNAPTDAVMAEALVELRFHLARRIESCRQPFALTGYYGGLGAIMAGPSGRSCGAVVRALVGALLLVACRDAYDISQPIDIVASGTWTDSQLVNLVNAAECWNLGFGVDLSTTRTGDRQRETVEFDELMCLNTDAWAWTASSLESKTMICPFDVPPNVGEGKLFGSWRTSSVTSSGSARYRRPQFDHGWLCADDNLSSARAETCSSRRWITRYSTVTTQIS